jgi:energy-coupling factor transporter ATP-binding protein EcfA2
MTELVIPSRQPILRKYMFDVLAWHGYIKFVGVPTLQENPDIRLEDMYVPQSLSESYIKPDYEPDESLLGSPSRHLSEKRRLVVLGDPGSGKSTLINYYCWYLSSGLIKKLPGDLAYLLPVPVILRDLALNEVETFDDLIQAFMKRPVAQKLVDAQDVFEQDLQAGKALILIDGLDEVGPGLRKKIRDIILQGFALYPKCFFLCTSRIVGYDEAPITHRKPIDQRKALNSSVETASKIAEPLVEYKVDKSEFEPSVCYVAPLDSEQIAIFAQKWYGEYGSRVTAKTYSNQFIKAIAQDKGTIRLARTPNLLAMMALIFKVRSQLPNGRALLYQDIAQAYLESIDSARGLKDPVPWQKKKVWLARVGFEMQLRRQDIKGESQELLISHAQILKWIKKAMKDTGDSYDSYDNDYAERYLEWIARRSGLLLPRGEGQFAFMHLSFQEYFAAVYIQYQMQNPAWLDDEEDDDDLTVDTRVKKTVMNEWANSIIWQQSLIFLFELFDGKQGWSNRLWRYCFKDEDFKRQEKEWINTNSIWEITLNFLPIFELQIALLSNPHTSINDKLAKTAICKLVNLAFTQEDLLASTDESMLYSHEVVLSKLLSNEVLQQTTLEAIRSKKDTMDISYLNLCGLRTRNITTILAKLASLITLEYLNLNNSSLINLDSLLFFPQLKELGIMPTEVKDTTPLASLKNLEVIYTGSTPITDFSPLSRLPNLKALYIDKNEEINVEGIDPAVIHRIR